MADENPANETPPVTTPTNPAAPPPTAPTPPPSPAPESPKPGVYLTPEQHAEINARLTKLDQVEAEFARKAREADDRKMEKALQDGDIKEFMRYSQARGDAELARIKSESDALRKAEADRFAAEQKRFAEDRDRFDSELRATKQRVAKTTLDRELSLALGSHKLVDHGVEDLMSLWRGNFTVAEDGDSILVRAADGRSVADFVAQQLSTPRWAHYVRAAGSSHGGTAHAGTNPSAGSPAPATPAQPEQPEQFRNMGEWALAQSRKAAPGVPNGGFAGNGLRPTLKVG